MDQLCLFCNERKNYDEFYPSRSKCKECYSDITIYKSLLARQYQTNLALNNMKINNPNKNFTDIEIKFKSSIIENNLPKPKNIIKIDITDINIICEKFISENITKISDEKYKKMYKLSKISLYNIFKEWYKVNINGKIITIVGFDETMCKVEFLGKKCKKKWIGYKLNDDIVKNYNDDSSLDNKSNDFSSENNTN